MKIIDERKNSTMLGNLNSGDCFSSDNAIFIMTDNYDLGEDNNSDYVYCVNLLTGEVEKIAFEKNIVQVEAYITIK